MAAKGVTIDLSAEQSRTAPMTEVAVVAIPLVTYKIIADTAAKRGHTFAQALSIALDLYSKTPITGALR